MSKIPSEIFKLIQKNLDGTITVDERKALDEWFYNFSPEDISLLSNETGGNISGRIKNRLNDYVNYEKRVAFRRRQSNMLKVALVLSIVTVSSLVYYFFSAPDLEKKVVANTEETKVVKDIAPGTNKAILTLGNGAIVILDSTANGQLGVQGNTKVIKLDDGQLHYVKGEGSGKEDVLYNSISTPRGGQYQVVLADGSQVWLNASSSLRFPTTFKGNIREVEISGEAYFEIAHNPSKPFRVKVKGMYVNVLGTHFNVMAYDGEEQIKTTLLEGSLKVSNTSSSRLIKPGQQVELLENGTFNLIADADIEEAVAWKNGKFLFNRADIRTIMRQVERWYDVDVVFERKADLHFTGELSRYANVSQLLRKLELTNEVHFRIEKGRITVLP